MKIARQQFELNRREQREQRKQSPLRPLLNAVQIALLFGIICICSAGRAQCYVDPLTGGQICTPPNQGWQPFAGADHRFATVPAPRLAEPGLSVDSNAHCRISVGDGSTGSGTLIAVDESIGMVLTCSHLFDGSAGRIVVAFPNGERFAARMIDRDRAHDLAALAIRRPNLAPLDVSEVESGGRLAPCGFGPNGQFRCVRGAIVGQAVAVGAVYPSLTIAGAVRPGDSGGGVLNTSGQVVGVVWGQRDGLTYATCGRPLREFLDRIRDKRGGAIASSPSPDTNWQAWSSKIESQISALDEKKQDKGQYLKAEDLQGYLRIADAPKVDANQFAPRSEVDGRIATLLARIQAVQQHVEQVDASKGGLFQGLSFGKLIVGALGLSGPLAAAVIVAGGLAGRRLKRGTRSNVQGVGTTFPAPYSPPPASEPIAVDTPPPPQRTVPETHYVSVEKDSFAKAHQWASEHVARKYPGATEILQALDSLIKQYLAAKS